MNVKIPIATITDIVNGIYAFRGYARVIDLENGPFPKLFEAVGPRAGQEQWSALEVKAPGALWQVFYWNMYHNAIRSVMSKSDEVPDSNIDGSAAILPENLYNSYLPFYSNVRRALDILNSKDASGKEDKVCGLFNQHVQAIIEQSGGVERFCEILSKCPLPKDSSQPVTLKQSLEYWKWSHNSVIARTFGEVITLDKEAELMNRGKAFYQLLNFIKDKTGCDLTAVDMDISSSLLNRIQNLPLALVTLATNAMGVIPSSRKFEKNTPIQFQLLGDAIMTLTSIIPDIGVSLCLNVEDYPTVLKATALGIENHRAIIKLSDNENPMDTAKALKNLAKKIEETLKHNIGDKEITIRNFITGSTPLLKKAEDMIDFVNATRQQNPMISIKPLQILIEGKGCGNISAGIK